MNTLDRLVATMAGEIDADAMEIDLNRLTAYDRFQASDGIGAAARYVAERAAAAGLDDVTVRQFPADGRPQWWSYAAPLSWTPGPASLWLGGESLVGYPDQPYSLAYQSAAVAEAECPLVLRSAGTAGDLAGCVVVLDDGGLPSERLVRELTGAGVRGVLAGGSGDGEIARRIELPFGCELFAFSLTPAQMRRAVDAARSGVRARVAVTAHRSASMPVVSARCGAGPGGILVHAHLCHPAPGANDNASGVAAALGVARQVAAHRGELRRPVRFVWAPEFVGMAAYLHAGGPVGDGAINLDMVGEDQRVCGGPLIVERGPDHLPSYLNAVVERCVRAVPPRRRSFSTAVGCDTWAWRATPFVGGSDHLLLADRSIGRPGLQLGHWPDTFHHTSGDTLDKVDRAELRRVVAVTAAAALGVCRTMTTEHVRDLERVVTAWGLAYVQAGALPPADRLPAADGEVDPWSGGLPAHRLPVASGAVTALSVLAEADDPGGVARRERAVRLLTDVAAGLDGPSAPVAPAAGPALLRRWSGPFNLRAVRECAADPDGRWLDEEMASGGMRAYATMVGLAYAVDDSRDRAAAVRAAAYATLLPIDPARAGRFFDLLADIGWITA